MGGYLAFSNRRAWQEEEGRSEEEPTADKEREAHEAGSDSDFARKNKFGLKGAVLERSEQLLDGSARQTKKAVASAPDYQHPGMPISLRRSTRIIMVGVPVFMFLCGFHCIYDAYWMFKERQQQKEINQLLVEMGVFAKDRSPEERQRICDELQDILENSNRTTQTSDEQQQQILVDFVKKYGRN